MFIYIFLIEIFQISYFYLAQFLELSFFLFLVHGHLTGV